MAKRKRNLSFVPKLIGDTEIITIQTRIRHFLLALLPDIEVGHIAQADDGKNLIGVSTVTSGLIKERKYLLNTLFNRLKTELLLKIDPKKIAKISEFQLFDDPAHTRNNPGSVGVYGWMEIEFIKETSPPTYKKHWEFL